MVSARPALQILPLSLLVAGALARGEAGSASSTGYDRFLARAARRSNPRLDVVPPHSLPLPRPLPNYSAAAPMVAANYSLNWAGAILDGEPKGTFTSVTGTFTVPHVRQPASASGSTVLHGAAAWVGIDGSSCTSALIQTGVDFLVRGDGDVSYHGWYEYIPAASKDYANIAFSAGDVVRVTVSVNSSTAGTTTIENLTTGAHAAQYVTAPTQSATLCQADAEWIVEDFEDDGGLVALADFGAVRFVDNAARTAGGKVRLPGAGAGAMAAVIVTNSSTPTVETAVEVDSMGSVTVTYIGQ